MSPVVLLPRVKSVINVDCDHRKWKCSRYDKIRAVTGEIIFGIFPTVASFSLFLFLVFNYRKVEISGNIWFISLLFLSLSGLLSLSTYDWFRMMISRQITITQEGIRFSHYRRLKLGERITKIEPQLSLSILWSDICRVEIFPAAIRLTSCGGMERLINQRRWSGYDSLAKTITEMAINAETVKWERKTRQFVPDRTRESNTKS